MTIDTDPLVVAVLATAAALYAYGTYRLWKTSGTGRAIERWRAAAFGLGQVFVAIALLSPLDTASDTSFAAHMTQHEILMIVAAPLIVMGRPLLAFVWALRRDRRSRVLSAVRRPPVPSTWGFITHPVVVLIAHGAVVWAWHARGPFEWALRNETVHAVQHLSFFVTAALFWWAILHGRYGTVGYGASALFVVATAMHQGLLGTLFALARSPWYPLYVARAPRGLDPIDDQRLAGLVMWVPAGIFMALVALAIFAAWLGDMERRARRRLHARKEVSS